jgi:hypothetical protein
MRDDTLSGSLVPVPVAGRTDQKPLFEDEGEDIGLEDAWFRDLNAE